MSDFPHHAFCLSADQLSLSAKTVWSWQTRLEKPSTLKAPGRQMMKTGRLLHPQLSIVITFKMSLKGLKCVYMIGIKPSSVFPFLKYLLRSHHLNERFQPHEGKSRLKPHLWSQTAISEIWNATSAQAWVILKREQWANEDKLNSSATITQGLFGGKHLIKNGAKHRGGKILLWDQVVASGKENTAQIREKNVFH